MIEIKLFETEIRPIRYALTTAYTTSYDEIYRYIRDSVKRAAMDSDFDLVSVWLKPVEWRALCIALMFTAHMAGRDAEYYEQVYEKIMDAIMDWEVNG